MMADELLNAQDLITAKKHDTFHSEVITGKVGGLSTGANIDYATNAVTGQQQNTLPAVLKGLGYTRVGTFKAGATLLDGRQTILWDAAYGGDGQEYGWSGAFPKIVPADSTPSGTGGIGSNRWVSRFDPALQSRVTAVEAKNTEQDLRIANVEAKNNTQDARMTSIESVNSDQNTRLSASESDIDALQSGQRSGVIVFSTYALLDAYTPQVSEQRASFKVSADPNSGLNGYYSWVSGSTYSKDASLVTGVIDKNNTSDAVSGKAVFDHTKPIYSLISTMDRLDRDLSYRDSGGEVWAVKDLEGKVALSIDKSANLSTYSIIMSWPTQGERADIAHDVWAIKDLEGKEALAIDSGGNLRAGAMNMLADDTISSRADTVIAPWSIKDLEGKSLLSFNGLGEANLVLSEFTKKQVAGGSYIKPSSIYPKGAFNIRMYPDKTVSTVQETDKTTFDVIQEQGLTPIAASDEKVAILLFSGQSNAGGGGHSWTQYKGGAKFPYTVMTFGSLGNTGSSYGNNVLNPDNLQTIIPLRDYNVGLGTQYLGTMASFAIENATRKSMAPHSFMSATTWYGAKPIQDFIRGTAQWNALMTLAESAPSALSNYGKEAYCPAYFFIQGESGSENYDVSLRDYIDDVIPEIKSRTGQSTNPEFFMAQINTSVTGTTETGAVLAQYKVGLERLGAGVTVVGPMYQLPIADDIHPSALGRMMQGDLFSEIYDIVINKKKVFQSLMPTSITLSGNVITVVFHVPAGDIEFDEEWVAAAPNFGFKYVDSTDSATITDVTIAGRDTIEITLDQAPSGSGRLLKYAQPQTVVDGWTSGRGQLMSKTRTRSFYYEQGYNVPEFVSHYCLRFTEAVI